MNESQAEALTPAVRQLVTLECVDTTGAVHDLDAEFGYSAVDPYAVTLRFPVAGGDVVWTFGRDLLASGLDEPSGDGDVHVWPCLDARGRAVVVIELCSPDGELLAQARLRDVQAFLMSAGAIVPVGHESPHLDLDALVRDLLGAELG